jgi:ketosteroid isomerase-like protein
VDASDVKAIEQLFERFIAAFNEQDVETLRTSYTEDALVMPPGQPSVHGPDAIISQLWGPTFDAFDVDATLPIDEIQTDGEWGFVRGTYDLRLEPKVEGDPVTEEGRYIDVVKKEADATWRIARAIWNRTG